MKVREITARPPVTIAPAATIAEAADIMAAHGVGALVVMDGAHLVGVVTDRDLVVRGLARSLPADARVDAVMSMNVVAIDADADVRDALAAFGHHAVRRLPVVYGREVTGVLSLDDLVVAMADQFGELTRGLTAQLLFPHAGDRTGALVAS